jgi:hypothetical protein
MMVEIGGYCHLHGDTFSPSKVEAEFGVRFQSKNEPGEIGTTGRYRGKPVPYGSACYVFGNDRSEKAFRIDPPLIDLLRNRQRLQEAGVTDVSLHFDVAYTDQCNFEMDPAFLKAAAELDLPVTITCYQKA